jgi:sortase (surface protein transpeptidase)
MIDREILVVRRPAARSGYRPDITPAVKPKPKPAVKPAAKPALSLDIVKPQPYSQPARPKQQRSQVLQRQLVPVPAPPSRPPVGAEIARPKRSKRQFAIIFLASVVFLVGLAINLQTLKTNHLAKAQVAALAKKTASHSDDSGSTPDETKPSGSRPYLVAPNAPKSIKIPKLDVDSRIVSLGVTSSNQLKAPYNIYDVGWYDASARPGDEAGNGAILLDGHVHGPTLPGVFVDIKKLTAGDTIEVTRGDNQVFTYKVVKVQNYDADTLDMGMLLGSAQPGQPGLNLITCGGPYDHSSGEYTQRTAVFAVQTQD